MFTDKIWFQQAVWRAPFALSLFYFQTFFKFVSSYPSTYFLVSKGDMSKLVWVVFEQYVYDYDSSIVFILKCLLTDLN